MALLVRDFMDLMERLAPISLAEEWDNVGLQVGSSSGSISSVLISLNVTGGVIAEAESLHCELILTHHPLIFQPVVSVSDDTETGRLIRRLAASSTAVYAAHTNLDSARRGLADIMGNLLGLMNMKPIKAALADWSKLVTFVPESDIDKVRAALFDVGAGIIGEYQHCSWSTGGTGTFLPMAAAQPSVGKVGREERVSEIRLEMVFPSRKENEIVGAIKSAHSYEEPAYDIYPLQTIRHDEGGGRIGELPAAQELLFFAGMVAELFGLDETRFVGDPKRLVRQVAVVPGSGADYITLCAARGADVLVTGDLKYHDATKAREIGLALIDIPHEVCESVALESWAALLEKELEPQGVKTIFSRSAIGYWQAAPRSQRQQISSEAERSRHHLYVDGGARGNPGPAAIGAVLKDPGGVVIETLSNFIGKATNNVAEYQALIAGVEMALDRDIRSLVIYSDSELIIRQLKGNYRVKNDGLRPYYQQARSTLARLEEYELKSISRDSNEHADELVNKALEEASQ